ncbi:insulinase family protein [Marinobacter profundi]|uniref:Protease 3 n=1 Tax=Marinobacter profundi TaxID=2666256 RepID=A0A2G1URK6_9GAMM|nr:insulinase family protein [Marinobacter profundi]PHQ17141.1 peptidase M16 [Marinobacter profundi]
MRPGTPVSARSSWLVRPLIVLWLLVFSTLTLAAGSPVKSPNDSNDYRYLTLDNGLRVLLVSSPGADRAAASVNVAVGSGDDPADREGLAHFLEHMLFLGTEKYPDPGEYQQFIKSHGGSHNAFTAFQDTNYFFDIQADYLEPALDRFAQQFAAPLFTADLVDRERQAVHSEYSAKQKEDGRRFYSVKKAIANPDHSFSQFAVGNLATLANTEERPLRPDLIRFWRNHYSANLMTLAVTGPQSLDQLEAMVRGRFAAIENRGLQPRHYSTPLYPEELLPAKVTAEALKDVRNLTLSFPIPSQRDEYRNKPASYVANLLGHEGPGSLFDVLKRAGLVDSLSAGSGMDDGQQATLEISMALTPAGLDRQQDILKLTFDYINLVREAGVTRQRFDEARRLSQIDFRFREKSDPVHDVMRLSGQLQHVAPEDVLQSPWMMESYSPEAYQAILDRLTEDNVLVSLLVPQPELATPRLTRWYEAAFEVTPLDPRALEGDTPLTSQLALPEPNPFIPDDLEMVAGRTMAQPERLGEDGGMALWYARDTRFGTPKANVYVSLRSPETRASARNNVLTQLLVDAVNTNLNAWAYPAQLAGLDYSVYTHLRGITIRVGGYSDKLHTLMTRILGQLANPDISEQRFAIARQNLIDSLRNKSHERPVAQTSEFIQNALIEGAWQTDARLKAASSITLEELRTFAQAFTRQLDPVMLAHGNLTEASALNIARQVEAVVLRNSERVEVARSGVRELPPGETDVLLDVDHPDTGYSLYMQGRDTGFAERAAYRLLGQIISSPFYEEIRTRRQLGYIVYATPFEMLETPALGFIVQSPGASAAEIDAAVRDFSQQFEKTLSSLDDAALTREKQAVISQLLEQDRRLGDISGRYWREIDRSATDFSSREKLAEAVKRVSAKDLLATFRRSVLERDRSLKVTTSREAEGNEEVVRQLTGRETVSSS